MTVKREKEKHGNFCTPLKATLTYLSNQSYNFYHIEHGYFHPIAVCNTTELRFINSIHDLIDCLGKQDTATPYEGNDNLFQKTKEVIESIISYRDIIFNIMRSLFPASASQNKTEFSDSWLKSAHCKEATEFATYIQFLNPIIHANNLFKHQNRSIIVVFLQSRFQRNALGFAVVGIDENEAIIPQEDIHPPYQGSSTAFSYNRFIADMITYFYYISSLADRYIRRIISHTGSNYNIPDYIDLDSSTEEKMIDEYLKAHTRVLFVDEYKKHCSQVSHSGKVLLLKNPAGTDYINREFGSLPDYPMTIQCLYNGDSHTKEFKVPYHRLVM